MEEIKIGGKAETGYMGGSKWTGINSHGYMRYSEINKIVKKAFRQRYPETKVSCTGSSFSGGQECCGTIFLKVDEALVPYEEFAKSGYYPNSQTWYYIDGEVIWGESPKLTLEMKMKSAYESFKKSLSSYSGVRMSISTVSDSFERKILKPEAIEKIEYLNALYDSFNSYDVNGMVDYFEVDFYKDVSLKLITED